MKKILSILFCLLIITASAAAQSDITVPMTVTAKYLYQTVSSPAVGSVGGEWAILGLARSGVQVPNGYYENYYKDVEKYVAEKNGILHEKKHTEYSRVALALTAIGKNPENVGGYNLIATLLDYDRTAKQGLNGAIWALIALDSGNYGNMEIREKYINHILEREIPGGGFALASTAADAEADITAMALTALARYRENENVVQATDRAIEKLARMQTENGGFYSYGEQTSESTAQVLVALCTVGISPDDERFIKNGNTLIDNLLSYYAKGKGFAHTAESNLMATEQALYALAAVQRYRDGKNALFDMSDCAYNVGLPSKNADITAQRRIYVEKSFEDIKNHKSRAEIEALACRGIINGTSKTKFSPDGNVTRAEFAALIVRALGLSTESGVSFADVSQADWFYDAVAAAYRYGIINGVSKTEFNPYGTITREEAAVMAARAAALCGINTKISRFEAKSVLMSFADYMQISDWASDATAFCIKNGILEKSAVEIKPRQAVTRAQTAQIIYNMLREAELL